MKCRWVLEDFECPRDLQIDGCYVFCKDRRSFLKMLHETQADKLLVGDKV